MQTGHEALFWHGVDSGGVKCDLCPQGCSIQEGEEGFCRARRCIDGKLVAYGYGCLSSMALDPIEKKPLYHFYPGSSIFSIGGWGCNFRCGFCQNWQISQHAGTAENFHSPDSIAISATSEGAIGVAYTYNEPLVSYEFVEDCAQAVHGRGMVNVLVTNGHIRPVPGRRLLKVIDALNVDIKSMEEGFYVQQCSGHLKPVLDFCIQSKAAGCHLEITNLLIPGLNSGDSQVRRLGEWISRYLGKNTPLHLSAYFPRYKLQVGRTPLRLLTNAHDICRQFLDYVYIGNAATETGQNTSCRECGALVIRRAGYNVDIEGLTNGRCTRCGCSVDVVQ